MASVWPERKKETKKKELLLSVSDAERYRNHNPLLANFFNFEGMYSELQRFSFFFLIQTVFFLLIQIVFFFFLELFKLKSSIQEIPIF